MMLLPRLMSFSTTIFLSVRESLIMKNLYLCTNPSSPTLFLTWGNDIVLSSTSRECTCACELMDVHQCNKVDLPRDCFVCLFITSFYFLSINKHCLGWKIFCTYSRFSEASVSERQISRIVWTVRNSRFPNIHILFGCTPLAFVCTPEIRWAEQDPEFVLLSSQVHTWEWSRTPRVSGLLEELCPHRYAVSRDETTCASFHLKKKRKLGEELSSDLFIETNSCTRVVILHRILYFLRQYQYKWVILQTLWFLLFFGTTVSRTHV